MKICLIGLNITNLILASVFSKKNLPVDIYQNNKIQRFKTKRTIAISAENFGFLKKISNANLQSWKTNEIKIYLENENSKEIINFKNHNKESFNLIKYSDLNNVFLKNIENSKIVKKIKEDLSIKRFSNKIKNYDLVINSDNNNFITKNYFHNKIKKNYKSYAYTFIINHKKINNRTARQIFTNYGPLAFLPLNNSKTSVVFSCTGNLRSAQDINKLFKKYNTFYQNTKLGDIEKVSLEFSMLRKYTHKNILAFGDLLHRIHPLAGQGFNMTIRDIENFSKILDKKISLGLPIDISVADEFQQNNKHLNYLYGKAIDGIYEFFRLDSKFNNSLSKPIFRILNNNSVFKKYSNLFSDKGLNL